MRNFGIDEAIESILSALIPRGIAILLNQISWVLVFVILILVITILLGFWVFTKKTALPKVNKQLKDNPNYFGANTDLETIIKEVGDDLFEWWCVSFQNNSVTMGELRTVLENAHYTASCVLYNFITRINLEVEVLRNLKATKKEDIENLMFSGILDSILKSVMEDLYKSWSKVSSETTSYQELEEDSRNTTLFIIKTFFKKFGEKQDCNV